MRYSDSQKPLRCDRHLSTTSAAVSSGVTLVGMVSTSAELADSLELHGSNSRHAASSTTLLAGKAICIVAFALGLMSFAALPLTITSLACPVRSTTSDSVLGSAWRLGVGFIRGVLAATLAVGICQSWVSCWATSGSTVACFWSVVDGLAVVARASQAGFDDPCLCATCQSFQSLCAVIRFGAVRKSRGAK